MSAPLKLELLDARKGPARANPLINALVEQLPAPGEDFPADERQAWLEMMEKAFTMAYGGAKAAPVPRKPAIQKRRAPARPKLQKPVKPVKPGPAFFVDRQHFARRRGGERILPHEVMDVLVDQRGVNGDLGKIVWADDSTGIPRGLQLDITIADAGD
jgi:hypothetical protein